MITNTGKNILAKYLVGQTQSYASYIAVGCGPKPLKALEFSISNKEKTGTLATLTLGSDHGLIVGQVVDIVGVDSEKFDGTYTISAVTNTTISYTSKHDGAVSSASATGTAYLNFKNKTSLDFEMFRVPVISRGYVTEELGTLDESGNPEKVSKIVLTAELPTTNRYEISEIGLFSAQSNPLTLQSGSRPLYSFSTKEGWQYHSGDPASNIASAIPTITGSLGSTNSNDIDQQNVIKDNLAFQAPASNVIFLSDYRTKRFEQPRYEDDTIFLAGNSSKILMSNTGVSTIPASWSNGGTKYSNHIHISNAKFGFDNNSVNDELRFAFSLVNVTENPSPPVTPKNVRVVIEFTSNDSYGQGQFARLEVDVYDTTVSGSLLPNNKNNVIVDDLSSNRYFTVSKKLGDLTKSSGFTWDLVKNIKVYASVLETIDGSGLGNPSGNYYVALDGLRFENVSTENPLYGLTGYTVIQNNKNNQPRTVIKSPNSTNYVEFRFAVDI
jgi:hypothetical protein